MKSIKSILLGYTLFVCQTGYSQILKIGIEGYQRNYSMATSMTNGPLNLNPHDYWYSLGTTLTYEDARNGIQVSVTGLPYKVDLRFKNFFGGVDGGTTLTIYGVAYRRLLINWQRPQFRVYSQLGIGVGPFKYKQTNYGESHISLNGNTIFKSNITKRSFYDKSFVLLPHVKIEVEKPLFLHLILSAQATYIFRNIVKYNTPLEEADYQYEYYGQMGSGHLADYGSGFLVGLGLKWQFNMGKSNLKKTILSSL